MRPIRFTLSSGLLIGLLAAPAWAADPPLVPPPPVTVTNPVWNAGLHEWSWSIQVGGSDGIASIHVNPAGNAPPITVFDLPGFVYTYNPSGGLLDEPPYNWQTPGLTPATGNLNGSFNLRFRAAQFTGQEAFALTYDYLWTSVDPDTQAQTVFRTEFRLPDIVIATTMVPEPSSWALMAAGGLTLLPVARRRRQVPPARRREQADA